MADQPKTDTAQFLAAEAASRLTTSLTTSGEEHFDQVVAVSQEMINIAIAKIHDNVPEINIFDGEDEEYGTISADLDPCQIIIPAGTDLAADAFSVTWRTRFKTGSMVLKPGANGVAPPPIPIDGWSVDVRVPLEFSNLDDNDEDEENKKKFKARQREWIAKNFTVEGDYRPERLYAKMSAARWNELEFHGSSFVVEGVPELWEEWKKEKANRTTAAAFEKIIKTTWMDRAAEGLSAIGTRFNFDGAKAKPVERPALFPPYKIIHQSYPYKIGPESGVTGWEKGKKTLKEPGTRNCLLYCENVSLKNIGGEAKKKEMEHKLLPHKGNYATIGNDKMPGTRVQGTFALSHQLFFEKFLLPNLQAFVLESQIYPKPATFTNMGEWGGIKAHTGYLAGHNPVKDPHQNYKNPIYKFAVVPAAGGVEAHYRAHVDVTTTNPELWHTPIKNTVGEWTMFYGEGSPTVTVKWVPGESHILINGDTTYISRLTTGDHQNLDETHRFVYPAKSWFHERYFIKWNMRIDVQAKDGDLKMLLSHDGNNFVTVTPKPEEPKSWHWPDPDTPNQIKRDIEKSMETQITHLKEVLDTAFDGQYKFVYPGNGQFDFGKTMFNKNGDLLADIKYKDLPTDTQVIIPQIRPLNPPPLTGITENTFEGTREVPEPRLKWTCVSPVKAYYPPKPVVPPPKPKPVPTEKETPAADPGAGATPSPAPAPPTDPPVPEPKTDTPSDPPAPEADNRVTFLITGTNNTSSPVYLSKLKTDLDGQHNGTMLMSVLNFITGRTGKQYEVEVAFDADPDAAKVSSLALPDVTPQKISERWSKATVVFRADKGPIVVQPGGRVNIRFKSLTGKPGTRKAIELTEFWCDEKGATPESGLQTFKEMLWFQLE